MSTKTYTVKVAWQDNLWVAGSIEGYVFEAKVYDEGSPFGIDEGRISKLTISAPITGQEVVGYERGWMTYPETYELEDLLEALIIFCDGLPPYEERRILPMCQTRVVTLHSASERTGRPNTMKLNYKVAGKPRKELVAALAKIVQCEASYLGAPSFSYKVGNYIVDKVGCVHCLELVSQEVIDNVTHQLAKQGFELDSVENPLTIQLPMKLYDSHAIARLEQIVANKESLFKRAFQTDNLVIEKHDGKLCFPWFTLTGDPHEADAYSRFIAAVARMAKEQKRVIPQIYIGENDKYTMRLFLVRLGLKGEEYKETRKILMRHLTGNGAWKYGAPPVRSSQTRQTNQTTPANQLEREDHTILANQERADKE
ncbi:hypothetical protein IJG04_00320 [Candidatus Saccharibacteria bacterium]|nr:hypothetical protein [Candidatus Saccharibacteria bacterium]